MKTFHKLLKNNNFCFDSCSLGVKVGASNDLLYYSPSWSAKFEVAGVTLQYIMESYEYPDQIKVSGRTTEQLKIYVSSCLSPCQHSTQHFTEYCVQ